MSISVQFLDHDQHLFVFSNGPFVSEDRFGTGKQKSVKPVKGRWDRQTNKTRQTERKLPVGNITDDQGSLAGMTGKLKEF